MRHLKLAAALLCAAEALLGTTLTFTSGTLLWANKNPFKVYDVTRGGDLASATLIVSGYGDQSGQLAFAPDLSAMYMTATIKAQIRKATPGVTTSTVYATTPFNPLGLVVTPDNKIYASATNGKVYDITSPTNPIEFASSLSLPRNLLWTPNGILVAEQNTNEVTNLGFTGGNKAGAAAFASGIPGAKAFAVFNGRIYVSGSDGVYDITSGGPATRWASGQNFLGLAATKTKLYATNADASPRIFDITAGGTFTNSQAWGYGLLGTGDTMFDAVPFLPDPEPPPVLPTPEGATFQLVVGGLLMMLPRLRRL